MTDMFIIAFGISLGLSLFGLYRAIADLIMTIISEEKEKREKEKEMKNHKSCYDCAYYDHHDVRYPPVCKYHSTHIFAPADGCQMYKEEIGCNTSNQTENS